MSPLDEQLIHRKAKLIEEDLQKLAPYRLLGEEAYKKDEAAQLAVERLMERVIGRLIDVNYHLLKEKFKTLPVDYYDSFLALAKQGVVPGDLARTVAKSVGLRNILAHEYDTIDPAKVYQSISDALDQVPKYLQSILLTL
ncbi:DUF86 domain-containing protein [Candidatus Gottesmanbacteria bacterium]|nr:DUF86 domain-containing protein [Candidatus Gottesmanbacteria bacterium]